MKMEYVLPKRDKERIAEFQKRIDEIRQSYVDEWLSHPFHDPDYETRFRNDSRVQILEKYIAHIYAVSVGKYIITAESEEDKEILRRLAESR